MRSLLIISSALVARLLLMIPLVSRGSHATTTTSIQDGDNFLAISQSAGIPVESLDAAKSGVGATDLYIGQVLNVPDDSEPATGAPASIPVSAAPTAVALTTFLTSTSPPVDPIHC